MATASETNAIYNAVLQRDPTDAELAAFVAASQTPEEEAQQIDILVNSSEVQTLVVPFLSLYQAIFGRVPDAAGLAFWVNQLRAGVTLQTIVTGDPSRGIDGFANSAEFIAEYGENVDPNGEEFITALYRNFLRREPDQAGLEFYMGLGDNATVGDVVIAFTSSPEFGSQIAVQAEVFLTKAANGTQDYEGSIYDTDDDGDVDEDDAGQPEENPFIIDLSEGALSVSGEADATVVIDLTTDPATVNGEDLDGDVSSVDASGLMGAGIDVFGSAAAETITGSDQADIIRGGGGGDTIDGGGGDDVLGALSGANVTGGDGADEHHVTSTTTGAVIADFTFDAAAADNSNNDFIAFLDNGNNAGGSVAFAGSTDTEAGAGGVRLSASDYAERNSIADIAGADDQLVIEIQDTQTTAEITDTMAGVAENAYVVVYNETTDRGEVWFDSDWSDTDGRVQIATLANIDSVGGVTGLTNAAFGVYSSNQGGIENPGGPVDNFFALTENIDVPGAMPPAEDTLLTAGDDVVVGNSTTLNPGDRVLDIGGNDKMNLFLGGQGLLADFNDSLNSEGVETVQVQADFGLIGLLTQNIQLDMLNATGVETLINESSTGPLTVTNVQNNVDLEIRNVNQTVAPAFVAPPLPFNAFNVIYDAGALGSAMATQNVTVENSLVLLDMGVSGGDNIGEFNFDASGNNIVVLDDQFGADIMPTSINISGNGFLALTDAGSLVGFLPTAAGGSGDTEFKNVTMVNASANDGGVIVDLEENEQDVTFMGGSGNDGVLLNSATEFDGNDMADGGEGRNFIGVDLDSVGDLGGGNIVNFQDLVLMDDLEGDETLEDIDSLGFQTISIVGQINGNILTLDDADGTPIHLLGENGGPLGGLLDPIFDNSFTQNGTIAFSDTANVNFIVGLDPDLEGDANPEAGYAKFTDVLGIPVSTDTDYTLDEADIEGVETVDLLLNGDFTLTNVTVTTPDVLETFTISGEGDFALNGGAGGFAGLTFDLMAQTGGFSNEGVGAAGSQTFVLGDLGSSGDAFDIDGSSAEFDGFDLDDDGTGDDLASILDVGGDGDRDFIEFTTDGFGNIVVLNFAPGADPVGDDLLDFSALGIDLGDLTFEDTDDTGGGADDSLLISSSEFDGNILLVGVTSGTFDAGNNLAF